MPSDQPPPIPELEPARTGPLSGVRVLDLSRILAGPRATQLLGDLGADVIKVERPATGDDTRAWGPPYVRDDDGRPTDISAYFASTNRNKRSVSVDLKTSAGQASIRALAADADVIVENFLPGHLARYGLDHVTMRAAHPHLVYCSITGYGQSGPDAHKPGYDLLAQAFGGIMSITGPPDGAPHKVGVGIADVMCGMYAAVGILAALRHRQVTGVGQHIDLALVDTQLAWLVNVASNYLVSGAEPARHGNEHPNIVPYRPYAAKDGHVIVAVGNDQQFRRLCQFLDRGDLADDERFATNPSRVRHRDTLDEALSAELAKLPVRVIVDGLEGHRVPAGPVNTVPEALDSDQVRSRGMIIHTATPDGRVRVPHVANPLNLSGTPVSYRHPPPNLGTETRGIEWKRRRTEPPHSGPTT